MKIFDDKVIQNKAKYIIQCLAATVTIFIILLILKAFFQMAVIAAFGATSFIVFTMPHSQASRPRFLLGGYLIGIFTGWLGNFLYNNLGIILLPNIRIPFFASLIVGIAIFSMVITDTEHPPAAAVALGFVLEGFSLKAAAVLYLSLIILLITKELIKKYMIDLV